MMGRGRRVEGGLETLASGQEGWKPQVLLPHLVGDCDYSPRGSGNVTARPPAPLPALGWAPLAVPEGRFTPPHSK